MRSKAARITRDSRATTALSHLQKPPPGGALVSTLFFTFFANFTIACIPRFCGALSSECMARHELLDGNELSMSGGVLARVCKVMPVRNDAVSAHEHATHGYLT